MSSTTSKELAGNHQPVSEETGTSGVLPELAEFVSARGYKFYARPETTDSAIFTNVVDDNEYNLPQSFEPDDIVVDIGAHIGGFSYAALERGAGRVYAYEPHPQNQAIASENLARFGERISCRQRAVWRSDQPSQMLYNEDLTGHDNTGGVSLLWNTAGLAVETISLDEILAEASDSFRKPIRLLKIDCEGSEYPILFTSTQLQIVEEICGEYHEVAPERIPDRAKIAGKYERFDRFALKDFFEDRGWRIVFEPKADLLGLFHARRDWQRNSGAGEFNIEQLMAEVREAVRLREAQGATSFINASAELFKLISADGLFAEQIPETPPPAEYLTIPGEFSRLRLQPEFHPHDDNRYHVNDLLKFHDREFIWNAYRAILKREPDERGLTDFLEQLRSGNRNKIDILASLSASAEGRRANVSVEGLRTPALIRKFYRLPVIGYFAELAIAIARLPALLRSQRQLENHLVAQQERLAGHIVQTNHQLLNKIDKLSSDTQRETVLLREGSISLQQSLSKLVQQQKQIAVLQQQQVAGLFREQRKLRESSQGQANVNVDDRPKRRIDLDEIEASLAEHLRGNPDLIKRDLEFYANVLRKSGITTEVLDLGCGRGAWLELLKLSGVHASGVDANRRLVDMGRARGLEIVYGDVLDHLRELRENSLQAVTGFHLIEHFAFHDLLELLIEIRRALKPGGLVILETPNPKNLVVGACNFYADPTHRKPLFPETLQFLLDRLGFARTRVEYLHPAEGSPFDNSQPGSQELHTWLFGPRDFAAFAWKS